MKHTPLSRRLLPARRPRPQELVLFFDGVCGLCNAVVDVVLRADTEERFKFSPLQGSLAATRLTQAQVNDLASLVLIEDGQALEKSAAALRIAAHLGGFWRLLAVFSPLPRSWRDGLYDLVARHRYRLFGKKESCRLPSPEERARFIP